MTWIISDKGPLLTGDDAAKALVAVVNAARSSGTPDQTLRQLAVTAATQPERLLADALASNDQTRRFARFVRPLSEIETTADATQRWFGWADLSFGKQWPVVGTQSWSPVSGQFAKLGSPLLKDDRHDGTEEAIFSGFQGEGGAGGDPGRVDDGATCVEARCSPDDDQRLA